MIDNERRNLTEDLTVTSMVINLFSDGYSLAANQPNVLLPVKQVYSDEFIYKIAKISNGFIIEQVETHKCQSSSVAGFGD